jgi:hypothetical protein
MLTNSAPTTLREMTDDACLRIVQEHNPPLVENLRLLAKRRQPIAAVDAVIRSHKTGRALAPLICSAYAALLRRCPTDRPIGPILI